MTTDLSHPQSADPSLEEKLEQSIAQVLQLASDLHQTGQIEAAEDTYRAILEIRPNHPEANRNLGLLAMQSQKMDTGLSYLEAALQARPEQAQHWLDYIDALIQADQEATAREVLELGRQHGLDGEAVEKLAMRLEKQPQLGKQSKATHHGKAKKKNALQKNVGKAPSAGEIDTLSALYLNGQTAEAEKLARSLSVRFPLHGFGWKVLGTILHNQGRIGEALPCMKNAAQFLPQDAEAHSSLGATLNDLGFRTEAEASLRRALALDLNYPAAYNGLGIVLRDLGRLDESEASLRQALTLNPDLAEAHNNLGYTLRDLGRLGESEASLHRALELNPDLAEAHSNLGITLNDLGRLAEGEACLRRALELKPGRAEWHTNLGVNLMDQGHFAEGEASLRHSLKLSPDRAPAFSNLLFCLSQGAEINAEELFAEHCRYGERFEAPLRALWREHGNSRDPERCLQVGFVSGDLYHHAVANFFEPVLAHLAGSRQLSLHVYHNYTMQDSTTQRLRKHCAHWNSVAGLDEDALEKKIRADGIDILIDLSGHTAHNRLLVFARKPAPIQASWIGYPGTTGLKAMDYYMADRFLMPPRQFDHLFTEKLAYLPANAPFLPSEHAPSVNGLPALVNGHVTFGSFNRPSKINPGVIALWSQLLRALPDARMLLGAMPEDGNYNTLIGWFAREGIARERLDFRPRSGMDDYLALHHHVDVCLDTYPYTGGTTTLHALWMGVPTLTLAGRTVAGRPGACILGHVGLDEFVACNAHDYVEKGLFIAGNIPLLADLRANLRSRFGQSSLGRPDIVADGLERALRTMWQRWCSGQAPASF